MSSYSKKRSASTVDDSDGSEPRAVQNAAKKSKNATSTGAPSGKDDDGNPFWELSNKRRVGVSQFKDMWMVNIREFYEKDGKMLPGKKGISLSIDQYKALLAAVPAINKTLRKAGHLVDADDSDATAAATTAKPPKEKSKPAKANIEATSDEDEG